MLKAVIAWLNSNGYFVMSKDDPLYAELMAIRKIERLRSQICKLKQKSPVTEKIRMQVMKKMGELGRALEALELLEYERNTKWEEERS